METVEVFVRDRADEISVDNCTAISVLVFNVRDYHQKAMAKRKWRP